MHNKNKSIVQMLIALLFLTIALFLGYLKNNGYLNKVNFKVSLYLYKYRINSQKSILNIKKAIESILQAPKYKQLYLVNSAQLQICQNQLNQITEKSNNKNQDKETENNVQILAVNWPEYGYIVINLKNNHTTKEYINRIPRSSLIIDNNFNFIGIISDSYNYFSVAKTLFTPDIKLSIYIKEAKAYGILYNQSGELLIQDISILHKLKRNYHVYILDARYPTNILLGTITEVYKTPQSATQKAKLKPIYSINNMFYIKNIKIIIPKSE